ncbi:hypothetical protein AVEN_228701-1 [Araneus ventricosus]|uniref:Uncharacterized protein n=1 Tax=Araneus ventricosus TaxID=182803 RepID=A0A4Y2TQS9_ARAVE|nr:hypothetical protein AVEN_228701-1 [Araneus ventricosus]
MTNNKLIVNVPFWGCILVPPVGGFALTAEPNPTGKLEALPQYLEAHTAGASATNLAATPGGRHLTHVRLLHQAHMHSGSSGRIAGSSPAPPDSKQSPYRATRIHVLCAMLSQVSTSADLILSKYSFEACS